MPITRVTNRIRPKNLRNLKERQERESAQARWLSTGSTKTHEELLGLTEDTEDSSES